MIVQNVKLSELKPNPKNVKKHTARQIQFVAEKIRKFGFNQPIIIDDSNTILAGHCRFESAKLCDMEEVPCVVYDWLSDEEKQELMVSDNKLNESEWEIANLLQIDGNILIASGFTLNDIDKMEKLDGAEPVDVFSLDKMELVGFEKYDYIVAVFRDEQDILNAFQKLGIDKVEFSFSGGKKIGLGRVIEGRRLLDNLK